MLFRVFWVLVPYQTQVDIPFVSKNSIFVKIGKYRYYFIPICTRLKFVPTVPVKLVPVPYYHTIFIRIMFFFHIGFCHFCENHPFWVNLDPIFAILLVKITNIWPTIAWISKYARLSDVAIQLMRNYTKRWKNTEIYSISWIFSFKKLQKYWKMAKITLPRTQILYVFIWSGSKNSLWRLIFISD